MVEVQIGQIWVSNYSPWSIRILDIYQGKEWMDKDLEVVVFEGLTEDDDGGRIYKNHLLQMFHLEDQEKNV